MWISSLNFYILSLFFLHAILSDEVEQYTGQLVVNTTRPEGFIGRFQNRYPGYLFKRQFQLAHHHYFVFEKEDIIQGKNVDPSTDRLNMAKMKQDPEIKFVQEEKRMRMVLKTVDPELENIWHLNGEVLPSMKVMEAWTSGYTGYGINVAVVDSGIETNHTDLESNLDTANDYDYKDFDDDPYPPSISFSHGTEVAGFVVASKNNNECTVGVAYDSTVIGKIMDSLRFHRNLLGIRLISDVGISDSQIAQSLTHNLNGTDIYSNSWGPPDGYGFFGPGVLTLEAIIDGITNGRDGKGVIYTWAAGNGELYDNCNGDGFVNSIYTIAITSVQIGQNAWYSEVCAAALAATYGGSSQDRYMTTTTTNNSCTTNGIQGTSYSTPVASAIIALTLEANPSLTWRDIQHLIVLTSTRRNFSDSYYGWRTNGAHKQYSQVMGFGLMNAESMVTYAKNWSTVPPQRECHSQLYNETIVTNGSAFSQASIFTGCAEVKFLEHVTTIISFETNTLRGEAEFYLISPNRTISHLLTYRYQDAYNNLEPSFVTWTFMSVHFWRESPDGQWDLYFRARFADNIVTLHSWKLMFYGTTTDPLPHVDQCSSTPCLNNETCVNLVYDYACCPLGFTGSDCSIPAFNDSTSTEATTAKETSAPTSDSTISTFSVAPNTEATGLPTAPSTITVDITILTSSVPSNTKTTTDTSTTAVYKSLPVMTTNSETAAETTTGLITAPLAASVDTITSTFSTIETTSYRVKKATAPSSTSAHASTKEETFAPTSMAMDTQLSTSSEASNSETEGIQSVPTTSAANTTSLVASNTTTTTETSTTVIQNTGITTTTETNVETTTTQMTAPITTSVDKTTSEATTKTTSNGNETTTATNNGDNQTTIAIIVVIVVTSATCTTIIIIIMCIKKFFCVASVSPVTV